MKLITLTKNKSALVDNEDFEWLNKINWQYCGGYAYHQARKKENRTNMHRLIAKHYKIKIPPKFEMDHFNREKLDNRKKNLRVVSRSINQWNRGLNKNNKTGFIGVSFVQRYKKWQATIYVKGRNLNLGHFSNIKKAIIARKEAVNHFRKEGGCFLSN